MSSSQGMVASTWRRPLFHTHHRVGYECVGSNIQRVSMPFNSAHLMRNFSWIVHHHARNQHFPLNCISAGDNTDYGVSDSRNTSVEPAGSIEGENSQRGGSLSTSKILEQLKRYGVAGILSYGLLNTAYYLTAFLVVWFYLAPVPGKMGYLAAVARFLKVMAMVWAGSQVTKLIRAAGLAISRLLAVESCPSLVVVAVGGGLLCALALAPLVDRGLAWFTVRYNFESRGKAFIMVVGFCLSLAAVMFLVVTLLWA